MSTRNSPTTAASVRAPLLTSGRSVSGRSQGALPAQQEEPLGCLTDADLRDSPNSAGGGHHVYSAQAIAHADYP
jgi:hypothetical protein